LPPLEVRRDISARSRPVHSPSWVVSPDSWVPGVLVSRVTVLEDTVSVVVSTEGHSPTVPGVLPPLEVRRDISARSRPVHGPSWIVSPDSWVPGVLVSIVTVLEDTISVVISSEGHTPGVPGVLPPLKLSRFNTGVDFSPGLNGHLILNSDGSINDVFFNDAISSKVESPSWVVIPDSWVPGILVSLIAVLEDTSRVVVSGEGHTPGVP